ncbi:MAG: hypothetical protein U0794_12245 [Isosphaeraceae bacterium]
MLLEARRPVIYGATQATTEAVRTALAIGDQIGALFLLGFSPEKRAGIASFQDHGRVKATLGEVKNRADLIVYWGCDPTSSHPRHSTRYGAESQGQFRPGGRSDRVVAVVREEATPLEATADLRMVVPSDREVEHLARLRMRISRSANESSSAEPDSDSHAIDSLAESLMRAHYGVLFFKPLSRLPSRIRIAWDAMSGLVRELNRVAQFRLMSLGGSGNPTGAEAAMGWQAGFSPGVDFRLGYPAPVDEVDSLNAVLERGELDTLLVIADEPPSDLSDRARESLARVPTIVVSSSPGSWGGCETTVGFPAPPLGVSDRGSVTRVDSIALPVRPILAPSMPVIGDWLGRLLTAIEHRASKARVSGEVP